MFHTIQWTDSISDIFDKENFYRYIKYEHVCHVNHECCIKSKVIKTRRNFLKTIILVFMDSDKTLLFKVDDHQLSLMIEFEVNHIN